MIGKLYKIEISQEKKSKEKRSEDNRATSFDELIENEINNYLKTTQGFHNSFIKFILKNRDNIKTKPVLQKVIKEEIKFLKQQKQTHMDTGAKGLF